MITLRAEGRTLKVLTPALLTSGSVGIAVTFAFDGAWNELARTAVFAGSGKQVDVLLGENNTCLVPPEVLARPGNRLRVGVYGTDDQETAVIPTVWADLGRIERGAVPSGIDPAELTPSLAAQVLAAASQALQTAQAVMAAAEAGQFDGETGPQGPKGADAVIWRTTSGPAGSGSGMYIALGDLEGPDAAEFEAGQMIVSSYDGCKIYYIASVTDYYAYIDPDHIVDLQGEKGDKGDPGDNRSRLCAVAVAISAQENEHQTLELADVMPSEDLQTGDLLLGTNGYTAWVSGGTDEYVYTTATGQRYNYKPDTDRFDVTLTGLTYNTSGVITGGTVDKTYQEILAAEQAGKIVRMKVMWGTTYTIIPLHAIAATAITFAKTYISDPGDVMGSMTESVRVSISNQNAISGEYHEY